MCPALLLNSIRSVCQNLSRSENSSLDIHVVFRPSLPGDMDDEWKRVIVKTLRESGCRLTDIVSEADFLPIIEMRNRYKKLALLRSLQRYHILQSKKNYSTVLNLDFDVEIDDSVDIVSTGVVSRHQIICANGFEIWNFAGLRSPPLYYDTLASVDPNGVWYYEAYSTSIFKLLTFGQGKLWRHIRDADFWPMQTCFGGLAVYPFELWSKPECDYIATGTNITFLLKKYTLRGKVGGDVCEHVVFQQCLQNATSNGFPLLVGIKPDLLVKREPFFSFFHDPSLAELWIASFVVVVVAVCLRSIAQKSRLFCFIEPIFKLRVSKLVEFKAKPVASGKECKWTV